MYCTAFVLQTHLQAHGVSESQAGPECTDEHPEVQGQFTQYMMPCVLWLLTLTEVSVLCGDMSKYLYVMVWEEYKIEKVMLLMIVTRTKGVGDCYCSESDCGILVKVTLEFSRSPIEKQCGSQKYMKVTWQFCWGIQYEIKVSVKTTNILIYDLEVIDHVVDDGRCSEGD